MEFYFLLRNFPDFNRFLLILAQNLLTLSIFSAFSNFVMSSWITYENTHVYHNYRVFPSIWEWCKLARLPHSKRREDIGLNFEEPFHRLGTSIWLTPRTPHSGIGWCISHVSKSYCFLSTGRISWKFQCHCVNKTEIIRD